MDHLIKGENIVDELEVCVRNATTVVNDSTENVYSNEKDQKYDDVDYATTMAILCSMVKQDYRMQEHIVLSLGLKSSSGELESYSLMWMWSLRPFIDEDFMLSAWKLVP
ncbi:hypothetical protein LIER_29440 [Lithospermum erythrorhizon]|uniref:Uncharacterized protein n=1 Tax=Lithospermum erythrorhizon TaxID=34254 RepID=A0AAV3RJ76_LITER